MYILLFSAIVYILGLTDIANTISVVLSSLMTGGFSPIADFSPYTAFPVSLVVIVMMVFGATSFFIHYRIVHRKFRTAFSKEFWMFIIISAIGVVAVRAVYPLDIFTIIFHVLSASTGTGFFTINFSIIPEKANLYSFFCRLSSWLSPERFLHSPASDWSEELRYFHFLLQ